MRWSSPATARWALGLALLLSCLQLPYARLIDDDVIQVSVLEGLLDCCGTAPFDLYAFPSGRPGELERLRDAGPLPWFISPDFKVHFFRPLSSLLLALDHAVFGRWAAGYRFQTIAWYLLLVAGLVRLLRLVLPADRPRGDHPAVFLASILFAVSALHWQVLAYTAARWVVIAAALGMLGLLAHARWRLRGWRPGRPLSVAAFALALLAGEAALAMLAYLLAFEMAGVPRGTRHRTRALLPVMLLALVYLVFYRLAGYGSAGGDGYINPLVAPAAYLAHLPGRALAMAAELLAGARARAWSFDAQRARLLWIGAGALGLMAALPAFLRRGIQGDERRLAAWMALAAAGSLLPLACSPPGSHYLMIPFIGCSAVIAVALRAWWRAALGASRRRAWMLAPLCAILIGVHLVLAPWRWFAASQDLDRYREAFEAGVRQAAVVADAAPARTIFLAPVGPVALQGFFLRKFDHLPMPASWWPLSTAPYRHRYRRTGPRTLELEIIGGQMIGSARERAARGAAQAFTAGDMVELTGLRVKILQVNAIGPTRVEFTFDVPLEDPSLRFMAMPSGRLQAVRPPAPGETLELPG